MKNSSVQDSSVQNSSTERISDQVWKWSCKQDCDKQKIQEIELLNKSLESALKSVKDVLFALANQSHSDMKNIQDQLQKQENNMKIFQKKMSSQLKKMMKILYDLKQPERQ